MSATYPDEPAHRAFALGEAVHDEPTHGTPAGATGSVGVLSVQKWQRYEDTNCNTGDFRHLRSCCTVGRDPAGDTSHGSEPASRVEAAPARRCGPLPS